MVQETEAPQLPQGVSPKTFTVLTCHFGEGFWISHLARQLKRFGSGAVKELVVVNQNRGKKSEAQSLESIDGVTRVIEFPPDMAQMSYCGHDHPSSLDRALRTLIFSTTHVIVIDTDCFPVSEGWTDFEGDAVVAQVPGSPGLSHPCFMIFPVSAVNCVTFSANVIPTKEIGSQATMDTGRLVGSQLIENGYRTQFLPETPAFGGYRGFFYMGASVYHHKHGSLTSHTLERNERIYRKKIVANDFTLRPWDVVILGFNRWTSSLRRALKVIYYARRPAG